MNPIKATLRSDEGHFQSNLELIGYDEAPVIITLNVEGLSANYRLEAVDRSQTRAHYQSF
jgi:hypothetical protein